MKIGLLAGDGGLPQAVVAGAAQSGHEIYIAHLTERESLGDGRAYGLGEFGKITKHFHKADVTHVCFAGNIARPDFKKIKPDLKTLTKLPGAIRAAREGDDALLRFIIQNFEKEGFSILAPQDICADILMPAGPLGDHNLSKNHRDDAEKAMKTALDIGRLDIGQAAIVCRGVVLAVEAQEGTDAMLSRVAGLPEDIRGTAKAPAGILAKMVKPGQEDRVDLPTLGPETIRRARDAGLAGIIVEAGRAFALGQSEMVALANEAGMFVVGLPPMDDDA